MNRYQRELAEMERRDRHVVRAVSFASAAALIVIALWSAGLPPAQWWHSAQSWFDRQKLREPSVESTLPAAPASAVMATPASAPASGQVSTEPPALISPQPLYLIATSPGRTKKEGTARIGTSVEYPQTYVGGAVLANGARLAEIHGDHVVLERDRKQAKLYLHELAAKTAPSEELLMIGVPQPIPRSPPTTREILTDYMRPAPFIDGETMRGYQVYPGRKSGIFSQLGLRAGDVITAINGAPVIDRSALDELRQITVGANIAVNVERDGKAQRLVLDGALIVNDLERDKHPTSTLPVTALTGA